MTLDIQYKIRNNPLYLQFLHDNSIWYKILTRNPDYFKKFEDDVKSSYKLHTTDKFSKFLDTFEMVQAIIETMK